MVLMLIHVAAPSAYSGDVKCTGDNKLQQIQAAWGLLKLGGSLGYELNSSLCKEEHLHREALSKRNTDPTADKIQVIKPVTLSSRCHGAGSSHTHPLLSFADFGDKHALPEPAQGGSRDVPAPPSATSVPLPRPVPGTAARDTHAGSLTPPAKHPIKGTAVIQPFMPANADARKRNGMGREKITIEQHQQHWLILAKTGCIIISGALLKSNQEKPP